ncbi:glycosyltransferase [Desulfovibrio sp. JC022]|uniref:glycosyltransferase n=1 Tax=Desulfovibrio sp. JC022 TaxID=2593642 RepID=UPI001EF1B271|nr:glycosyltransferase [Desulfovibrio sp. JC022]
MKANSSTPEEAAEKHLRYAKRRNAKTIILFGAGSGTLGKVLAEKKSSEQELIICDLYPEHIRMLNKGGFGEINKNENYTLLTDSSIWALLLLLSQNGYETTDSHLILNPELDGQSKNKHQNLQKLFSGTKQIDPPEHASPCKISAAAILSPDEPELADFITNFPDWIDEIVLVWDCADLTPVPQLGKFHRAEIINVCHHLEADFSAQRNRMLENCSGDWIIYLDADERLSKESWDTTRLMTSFKGCNGWYLPRMTFYPDREHCRIGYGLWPDLQLRLFRNSPSLKFVNKIHEQLTGINGASGILTNCPIQHLTHLLKSRKMIESKLEKFNSSTGGNFSHQLGNEFPHLANKFVIPRNDWKLSPLLLPDINMA